MQPICFCKASDTPTTDSTISGAFSPAEILPGTKRRLGWAGLIFAGGFFVGFFGWLLLDISSGWQKPFFELNLAVNLTAMVMGVAVFALSRYSRIKPDQLLDFGLVFLVLGSLCLSMTQFWGIWPEWSDGMRFNYLGIPWECVWIIMFPLLAPNTPGKTLVAAVTAASTAPVVFLLSKSMGATSAAAPVPFTFGYFLLTTYFCAAVSFIISLNVNKLARQLKQARDVGSYRLVKRLGAGGMGEVWIAQHKMLARPAAVKLIKPEVLGSDEHSRKTVIRRFEREAQATAALRSYHTIEVYDFGATEDGAFYYVMELLRGFSLEALVERFGPVDPGRAVSLLRQVCHSLGEAHENGMIHRDIKPANIHVSRLGPNFDYDFVKVLDFGLVKSRDGRQARETDLTAEGVSAGTPAFMAPEMAIGNREIDGRADLYCLGCVGFWLVTGQRVFEAETPIATILAHVQDPPVPPSQRSELEIPDELERIILACLEKDPAKRPQSAAQLDELLAGCSFDGGWNADHAKHWWDLHAAESDALADIDGTAGLTTEVIV